MVIMLVIPKSLTLIISLVNSFNEKDIMNDCVTDVLVFDHMVL